MTSREKWATGSLVGGIVIGFFAGVMTNSYITMCVIAAIGAVISLMLDDKLK